MRKTIFLALLLSGVLILSFNILRVKAITLEEIQAQIQQLLQAINSLRSQVPPTGPTQSVYQIPTSTCPFVNTLYKGYSDVPTDEVKALQTFLKQDPSIYPEGLVTGYFGRLTEAAVKRFQAKYGIKVTGEVGPETRAKLCELWQKQYQVGICGWCGTDCVRKTPGMYCPQVMPPEGYECKEANNVCTKVPISVPPISSCTTPNGKYSMTLEEAKALFRNSECKKIGDPDKLPIRCYQCDPYMNGDFYNAIYGPDYSLADRAAYRIGGGSTEECIINIKSKEAYINAGPSFCTGATDVGSFGTIVCGNIGSSSEGWYLVEGYTDSNMSPKVTLLKQTKCSNCQLLKTCINDKINFIDSCTNAVITSYGAGEFFNCNDLPVKVPPINVAYIREVIKNLTTKPSSSCTDSDGGNNIYTKGTVTYNGQTYTDSCLSDNTLAEYYCENGRLQSASVGCPRGYTCTNGACSSSNNTCTETDGGQDIYKKGTVTVNSQTYTDKCISSNTIVEYYCPNRIAYPNNPNLYEEYSTTCPLGYTCQDGACIPSTITVDIKANDSNGPVSVPYNAPFKVSWTSTGGATTCIASGHFVPLAEGGLWTDLTNLPPSGNKLLYAKHANFGYLSPLELTIRCLNGNIKQGEIPQGSDTVYVNVIPPAVLNCSTLYTTKTSFFDQCRQKGFDGVCFNKYTGDYQGCGMNSNNQCTVNNTNAINNIYCPIPAVVTTISQCVDSDGGNNIYTKGTVTYNGQTYTDECAYCTGYCPPPPQPCPPVSCGGIKEYYCEGGIMKTNTQVCPSGYTCQDGACKPTSAPFIKVISPNGGEQLTYGTEYLIKWDASLPDDAKINIEVLRSDSDNANLHDSLSIAYNLPSTQRQYKWIVRDWGLPCFAKGTKVLMSNGVYKNIEDIKEGEYVTSYNIQTEKFSVSKVVQTIHRQDPIVIINQALKAAPDQLIFTTNEGFKNAIDLAIGDLLLGVDGKPLKVASIQKELNQKVDTFDLVLDGEQNFFAEGYLVHSAPKTETIGYKSDSIFTKIFNILKGIATTNKVQATNLKYQIRVSAHWGMGGKVEDTSDGYFTIIYPPSACTDSDGGYNIYTKGIATYNGYTYTDFCFPTGNIVSEYICDSDGKLKSINTTCPSGYTCQDGACKATSTEKRQCGAYFAGGMLNLGGIFLNLPVGQDKVTREQCKSLADTYKETIKYEVCSNIRVNDPQDIYIKWGDEGSSNLEVLDHFSAGCQFSSLNAIQEKLSQLTDLLKKLSAALIEMVR